tara:strand:+ start:1161 stop:2876 length:1716 start_codon:yes stop_codon:yes gene_type:complete
MSDQKQDQTYDYIIVGAGSAGCALASRLSREASRRVLLLEAGPRDTLPFIHIPLGFAFLMDNPKVNWCYVTEPEPNMNGRRIAWPRGKVLGGCSSINGMVYIRGQREDYDHWHALGNEGWSYDEVLPYFKRSEYKVEGADQYHGRTGALWVEEVANDDKLELADLFIQAAVQTGLPYNSDFNGPSQEGAGYYQLNIRNGKRQSSARTFLASCENRPNLNLVTDALCHRVTIENGRATGVEYSVKAGKTRETLRAQVTGEVILCGGVINSPQLLELSGVGDGERLRSIGIPVTHHLPGVGENLQDHLTINVQQGLHDVTTFFEETRPLAMGKNLLRYFTRHRGLLAHPASQAGVFFRTDDQQERPDAQVHFAPAASESDSKGRLKTAPGTTATVCHLRPESRGCTHIRSNDPAEAPAIRANYLSTESDIKAMLGALRRVRDIFAAPALERYRGHEILPGPSHQSDEELLEYIKNVGESVYHPVGSCKMGHDEMAVVDHRLNVHGIAGLRIADASIMPQITSGNTHAPAVMIAEKCADMILADNGAQVDAPHNSTGTSMHVATQKSAAAAATA